MAEMNSVMEQAAKLAANYQPRPLTYMAAPYFNIDAKVMSERVKKLNEASVEMLSRGRFIFNPLSHSQPMDGDSIPVQTWYELDLRVLSSCDELVVVQMDGWRSSVGVMLEIAFASRLGIPVWYLDPNTMKNTMDQSLTESIEKSMNACEELIPAGLLS